jgi:hypothetical protein
MKSMRKALGNERVAVRPCVWLFARDQSGVSFACEVAGAAIRGTP